MNYYFYSHSFIIKRISVKAGFPPPQDFPHVGICRNCLRIPTTHFLTVLTFYTVVLFPEPSPWRHIAWIDFDGRRFCIINHTPVSIRQLYWERYDITGFVFTAYCFGADLIDIRGFQDYFTWDSINDNVLIDISTVHVRAWYMHYIGINGVVLIFPKREDYEFSICGNSLNISWIITHHRTVCIRWSSQSQNGAVKFRNQVRRQNICVKEITLALWICGSHYPISVNSHSVIDLLKLVLSPRTIRRNNRSFKLLIRIIDT